jgi:dTDP-4-amino-4,6-dideoxygalactose transaminase
MESPMSEPLSAAGQEVRHDPIPLIDLVAQHQEIESQIAAAVSRVFSEQRFILGDEVAELECDLAEYCDSREAIGCASGTDALLLAMMALDIGPGDEVITSPYTFFATGSSIYRLGASPVFCDIDPVSYNLDPQAVDAAVTPRTRAILPVHLFGQCAEMEPLWRIAGHAGVPIIEDACQAVGAEYQSRRAGVLGTLGCFSFFPTKNLGGAGDGGLITTDDPALASRIRRLRVTSIASALRAATAIRCSPDCAPGKLAATCTIPNRCTCKPVLPIWDTSLAACPTPSLPRAKPWLCRFTLN